MDTRTMDKCLTFPTFESNIYTRWFMVDRAVVGGNWLELPRKIMAPTKESESYCQIECDVMFDHSSRTPRKEIFKVGAVQNFVRRYRVRWEKRFLPGRRTGSGDSNSIASPNKAGFAIIKGRTLDVRANRRRR